MKKLLLCAAASLCLCSQAYDMLFDGANLKQNEQKTSFWIFAKEKGPFGGLKLPKEDELNGVAESSRRARIRWSRYKKNCSVYGILN